MAADTIPPPLRDGDHLKSDEFIRRWQAMPDLKHAELVDGMVYMASPVGRHRVPVAEAHGVRSAACQFIKRS